MYNESLTYDKNGNIMSLLRNGNNESTTTQIDNLTYSYGPTNLLNRLTKVVDSQPNTAGLLEEFKDNGLSTDDFDYDVNGNMIKDNNKNISEIVYNHLNLPTNITFGTAGDIVYIYNATGQKVQKVFNKTGQSAVTTDYLGGYQYNNAALKFFPTAEGYVEPNGSSYKYVYQYKDHLGNVRLSYDKTLAIQEENNYYPFGLKQKGYNTATPSTSDALKYKYNGKELQDELGLNMYDYGFRNYMPDLGRWGNMDSKTEAYYPLSPYQYVLNNPIVNIDVKGQWTVTRHYNMTYNSLSAAGIGKEQADLLAHYASVYADNPGWHIALNNFSHPTDMQGYRPGSGIDYSGTTNSQVTDYKKGDKYNYNIWHSMRSKWEEENNTISAHDATERGMEFGWGKIFESAKSGTLNDLKKNSKGIEAWGQGTHALQDAYAHKGRSDVGFGHVWNDRIGDTSGAQRITDSATTVHNILSGNWKAFDGKTKIKFDAQGMSRDQYNTVMNAIYKFLKK